MQLLGFWFDTDLDVYGGDTRHMSPLDIARGYAAALSESPGELTDSTPVFVINMIWFYFLKSIGILLNIS